MPIFYRGAGAGTFWQINDARVMGFSPRHPGATPSIPRLMQHIARTTTTTPYVSLTRSYAVAWAYAMYFGRTQPTPATPGVIYQVELDNPLPPGLQLTDPVKELGQALSSPLDLSSYHHDGDQEFLLGVVDRIAYGQYRSKPCRQPGGGTKAPNLSMELETLVFALRDAEILAVGNIPASSVRDREEVS